jgi:hypothetical protein
MRVVGQPVACALIFVAALLSPALAAAQSPFDGTWRIMLNQARFSPKPIVAFLSEGWYHCPSCNPQLDVKADGADQPVLGQAFDTISVREIDSRNVLIVTKKGGVIVTEQARAVSADGKKLTIMSTEHPADGGRAVTSQITGSRIGIAPAAINGTSGKWRLIRVTQSDNGLLITLKSKGDQLTMMQPTGETYTARFDGKDYPVKGAINHNAVSLKRIGKTSFQEIDKRDGVVVEMQTMTVSADGRKMTIVDTNSLTDRTTTYIAIKQ